MQEELQNKLYEDYPELGKKWYCEHGAGWYNIIDALLAGFVHPVRMAKDRYEYAVKQFDLGATKITWDRETNARVEVPWTEEEVAKLKEAYDTELERLPVIQQVKEKFGTLRFYVHKTTDANRALIDMAEHMSGVTCEDCGNRGIRRGGGWIKTLCNEHAESRGMLEQEEDEPYELDE